MKDRKATTIVLTTLLVLAFISFALPVFAVPPAAQVLLDPRTIPKYVNQLTGPPPAYVPTQAIDPITQLLTDYYTIYMRRGRQQILPTGTLLLPLNPTDPTPDGKTEVWGYYQDVVGVGTIGGSPGATFEAIRDIPLEVKWVNEITGDHMFPVDPSLHWADPNGLNYHMNPPPTWDPYPPGYLQAQSPVPLIPHLHGGEVQSYYDGHPEAWFTYDGKRGPEFDTSVVPYTIDSANFYYPNAQPPTTLWYHDHALGITRINVMSGLAGFYLLRDPADAIESNYLPPPQYEMPLVIQDRTFKINGEFWFPEVGLDPAVHPYWMPEFLGDTIMVNGLVWPNLDVDAGQYRLRILDGSNARFYTISFLDRVAGIRLPFIQIGSDGGYLQTPVVLNELTIAPGERVDILVDFSGLPVGRTVQMLNSARAPFPKGTTADPQTVGQIMQFTVKWATSTFTPVITHGNLPPLNPDLQPIPPNPPQWPTLPPPPIATPPGILVLWEVMGPLGPTEILLNGQTWGAGVSENPKYHAIEEWMIVNPTADTHPIHLHLVQFQLVSRQSLNTKKYVIDWLLLNAAGSATGVPPWDDAWIVKPLDPTPYLKGKPAPPPPNEMGWKDTIQMNPGEVTVIRIRFEPIDGSIDYPFDPTAGPGYVWHCHILDHEDNEMMRPYVVLLSAP